jgi:hypothetical protein
MSKAESYHDSPIEALKSNITIMKIDILMY